MSYVHKFLGPVVIDKECQRLNQTNADSSSCFVRVPEGNILEVTKKLVVEVKPQEETKCQDLNG